MYIVKKPTLCTYDRCSAPLPKEIKPARSPVIFPPLLKQGMQLFCVVYY